MIEPSAEIHPQALIESGAKIGARTRVWAFSHILTEVNIGSDCNICDHTFIESGVTLGNRVTVKSGVYLWTGIEIEDDVFIGPCVAFTNDKTPRSKCHRGEYPKMLLKQGCSIGANSTLLPGITIGSWSMIGAGSVVTRDVPKNALVFGNPARIKGWVCRCGKNLELDVDSQVICHCGIQFGINRDKNQRILSLI